MITSVNLIRLQEKISPNNIISYAEVLNEDDLCGYGGPLYPGQAEALESLSEKLRGLLAGRDPDDKEISFEWMWNSLFLDNPLNSFESGIDPLSGELIWNTARNSRHTPTGDVITALSAVDNAIWDLRGKIADKPVCKLLKGTREVLPAYISTHPDDDVEKAIQKARGLYDTGNTAQKWFFRWGPVDGDEGFRKNCRLAEGIREELGDDAVLMFDFATSEKPRCPWDVEYAVRIARILEPIKPLWLEEPFFPEEIDFYRHLKGETGIPLACGEHTYTRWNIKPFLEEGLIDYVQSDPEWCGGISESLEIAELVKRYNGVVFIPHGHQALAASQVVAAQPESLCPMVEHGKAWLPHTQQGQVRNVVAEEGKLTVPQEPGIGPDLDWDRFHSV